MVELRHLRYFVATVEAGSISAAAATVHVTQPALSRQLRQLEDDLGVALFDRGPGRVRLSRTGAALLPRARAVLDEAARLRADAAHLSAGRVDGVVVAAPTVTLTDVVSPFVAGMGEDDPVVDVRVGDGASAAELLADGADLAIASRRPPAPYRSRTLASLPVWAYVPPDDPWVGAGAVALDDLLSRPVIGLPPAFTAREALETAVAAAGLAFSSLTVAANGTIAQALAAAGRGVAVVSDDPRYGLVPLPVGTSAGPLRVRLVAAWDGRVAAASSLADLAERLRTWVVERYDAPSPPGAAPDDGVAAAGGDRSLS